MLATLDRMLMSQTTVGALQLNDDFFSSLNLQIREDQRKQIIDKQESRSV